MGDIEREEITKLFESFYALSKADIETRRHICNCCLALAEVITKMEVRDGHAESGEIPSQS